MAKLDHPRTNNFTPFKITHCTTKLHVCDPLYKKWHFRDTLYKINYDYPTPTSPFQNELALRCFLCIQKHIYLYQALGVHANLG